ncbi:MAG: RNA polymerase sigma factor SigZ [Cyanobacteria bacterium P01_F01_bin.150]
MNESTTTEELWNLLSNQLRKFLRKRVSDEQVAEDLLQETFIRIHQKIDSVDNVERLTSWVFQIARNLVIDYYRSKARKNSEIAVDLADVAVDLETETRESENINELVMGWFPSLISQLPETYREAVELYELKRVPQKDIAERLQISLSGAKSKVQRGRAKLKDLLHECCTFELDQRGNVIDYQRRCNDDSCDDESC